MSKYKPYPKYKDSGVEWLGQIPEEWEVKRVKDVIKQDGNGIKIGPFGSALKDKTLPEGSYKIYNQANLINAFELNRHFVDEKTFEELRAYEIKPNDILLSMMGTIGKCKIMPREIQKGIMDSHLIKLRLNDKIFPKFFEYFYDKDNSVIVISQLECLSVGTTMNGLNSKIVKSIFISFPAFSEQQAITAFLDHETSHVDTIISKQQHLIELLEEKRIAIISHVVTKGLNPNVSMKDSGVEWLGNMPTHWQKSNVKFAINSIEQGWSPQCYSREAIDEEYGVLKVGCVNGGHFNEQENKVLPIELSPDLQYEIKEGDVLISRANVRSLVGGIAIVKNLTKKLLLCDKLYRISLQEHVDNQFFVYSLSSGIARFQYERSSTGASDTMQNISQETVKNLHILLPPLNEQKAIVDYLEDELSKIDAIINKTRQAIALAQERRAAIISAAVTGKICVSRPQNAEKPLSKSLEYFQKVVLAAEITDQLHKERTFGRVKLQKILYLSEYHAQLPFQRSEYQRYAAGPHDPKAMYSIEGQMKKQKWFDSRLREGGYGKEYVPLERHEAYKQYYGRYFAEKHEVIQRIIDLLRPKDTQFCEVVATLYGVWNDFLLEGQQPDDAAMFREAVTNWAPEKKKVPAGLWPKALYWMRENSLVPSGWGEPTIHRQEA